MADGYGRVAGRPAAVIVLSGVGLRSAAPGLETAFDSSSPVLVISDHATEDAVPPALAGIVKWGARATRPAEVPALVRRALVEMGSGRPRPVYLGVSHAVLAARERVAWAAGGASAGDAAHAAAGLPPDAVETHPGAAGTAQADAWADSSAGALERAAELLAGAARPAIVAGTGVARARAAAALCTLAERLQAPVATSVAAKGVFSDRHPLCLGAAHPPYRPLTEYLRSRDVVLLAGTGWPAAALAEGTRTRTVRIDVEPRCRRRGDDSGGCRLGAGAARGASGPRRRWRPSRCARGGGGGGAAARAAGGAERAAAAAALPDRGAARRAPRDGILVHDMTQLGYYSRGYFPVYQPDSYQIPRGNLGAALPLALGAKLACPRRAVVALCGDGGLLYHVQELVTAVQYGINVVVVVCNDNAYGNVLRAQQEEFGGRVVGTRLRNPDFPTLAAAFGISGQRAADAAALRRMLAAALKRTLPP